MSATTRAAAATALCAASLLLLLRFLRARAAATVLRAPKNDAARLLSACPSLASYTPPLLLPGPHLNTLWGVLLRRSPQLAFTREALPLPDGGTVNLDWRPQRRAAGSPVVLLLHGLTGGSHERYLQWQILALEAAGAACVVLNARGCGGAPLTSPLPLSAALTGDVRAAVRHVRRRVGPGARLSAVGFCLGAGILSKFVCEEGAAAAEEEEEGGGGEGLCAAVAVAASVDFFKSCARLEAPLARALYNAPMARALQRYVRAHLPALSSGGGGKGARAWDPSAALAATTLRGIDAAAVAPLHGFPDTNAYYAAASSTGGRLGAVRIPLLFLNARDDPICDAGGLLEAAAGASEWVTAVVTEAGGHVAWVMPARGWGGLAPSRGASWETAGVVEWLKHVGAL